MATWKISNEMEPNFVGGLLKNKFVKGTMFIVKTVGQMKSDIPYLSRLFDATTTTLCFVESDNTLYKLVNNPTTDLTTDSDWSPVSIGGVSGSAIQPIGEWDSATGYVVGGPATVLQDTDAFDINGSFYYVTNATGGRLVTFAGLFRSQTLTVYDGDYVISVGDYFAVLQPTTTWETLVKPAVIDDYVAGTVISHSHAIGDVVDLSTQLSLKFDAGNVADNTIDFGDVPDTDIIDKKFLTTHYYLADEVYTQGEVDALIAGVGGGFTFPGNANEIFIADGASGIATSSNLTYDPVTNNLIIATALSNINNAIGSNNLIFGVDHIFDSFDTTPSINWNIIAGEAITIDMDVSNRDVNNGAFFGYSNTVQTVAASGTFGIYSPFIAGTENELLATKGGNNVGTVVLGWGAKATASGAFVHGYRISGTEKALGAGDHSVAIYTTTSNQTVGHGALANYSVIIGGLDHNIPNDSPRSVILGGDRIKAAATVPDTVYVPYLRVGQGNGVTITQDDTKTNIAVIDEVTGEIKWRDSSTFAQAGDAWLIDGTTTLGGTLTTINLNDTFLLFDTDDQEHWILFQGADSTNNTVNIFELYNGVTNSYFILDAQRINTERGFLYLDGINVRMFRQDSAGDTSPYRQEISFEPTGMFVKDQVNSKGFEYVLDYSANFTARSLVDKAYVDSVAGGGWPLTGAFDLTGDVIHADASQNGYFFTFHGDDGGNEAEIYWGPYIHLESWNISGDTFGTSYIDMIGGYVDIGTQNSVTGANITSFNFWGNDDGGDWVKFTDNRAVKRGIEYAAAGYVTHDRALVDKGYVDTNFPKLGATSTAPSANTTVQFVDGYYYSVRESLGRVGSLMGRFASSPFYTVSAQDNAGGNSVGFGLETSGSIVGVPWISFWRVNNLNHNIIHDVGIFTISANGTPSDGYGGRIKLQAETSTTAHQEAGDIEWSWDTATHATRKAKMSVGVYNVAAREEFIVMTGGGNLDLYAPNGIITADKALQLKSYTVTGAPSPTGIAGAMIYVTDETGGAVPAFSDGTNWRRVTDRAIIA